MKLRIQLWSRSLLALPSLLLFSACGSPIFDADFDSDTVGALPDPSPPGAPDGDTIWSTAAGSTEMLAVVNNSEIGSQALRFANDGPNIRFVGYLPVELSSGAERVYASWIGVLSGDARLDIWLGNTHFARIAGMRFEGGNVFVETPMGFEAIGSFRTNVSHVIILTFNRSANTYNLSFIQGGSSANRTNIPVLNVAAAGTTQPTLYMAFLDGESDDTEYVADEIRISTTSPDD